MADHPSLLITILAFLLVLGPLVLVHELGHYLVGRWFGVKADAFSIGFGKELAGWTDRRGTRWKLSALPLGGYVQFAGDMNAASMPDTAAQAQLTPEERAQTFQVKPLYQRALIVLAGPLTNLVVAIAIFAAFNMIYGRPVVEAEVAGFTEKSDARAAGLRIGDRIVRIDGSKVESFSDIPEHVVYFPGRTLSVAVERSGETVEIPVKLSSQVMHDSFGNEARIADLGIDFAAPVVGGFSSDSPAQKAGLEEGDRIVAIDAAAITSFNDVRRYVQANPGRSVSVRYERDGRPATARVTLGSSLAGPQGKQERVGLLGVRSGKVVPVGPVEAVTLGAGQSIAVMRSMVTGIVQIVTGERSVKELGGPIKIAKYSGEQFSLGWADYTWFVAMISINLAFINLLPIPGLDGGHLAMYAAEAVRRKPMGARSQEWALRTGMALVLALMLFVTVNDLLTLPWFG